MKVLRFLSYGFIGITIVIFSCKKSDNLSPSQICTLDSISTANGFSFKFITENNKIKEAYSFANGELWHKITYIYSGNYLTSKSFYFYITQNISRKYAYEYDGDLLKSITEYKSSSNISGFYKGQVSLFSYNGSTLSSGKALNFSPNDSINPVAVTEYNFFGANANADSSIAVSTTYTPLKYKISSKENPIRKNYNFLANPSLELYGIVFNPRYFPFLLNKNYTISYINKYSNYEYSDLRVGSNANGQPTFFYLTSNSALFIWDYLYQCN